MRTKPGSLCTQHLDTQAPQEPMLSVGSVSGITAAAPTLSSPKAWLGSSGK